MAQVELMDEDNVLSDFDDKENLQISNVFSDDKENSLQNSNVFSRTPSTEKGYEELDASELNMKLRYSVTPASSPMSQSYTANCVFKDVDANNLNKTILYDNVNLTHSLNSTITKDNSLKSTKIPLQTLQSAQFTDDKNISSLKLYNKESKVTITVSENDIDDNLSLPSTSSSSVQTPQATTPTKEEPKTDAGSPIMRGLKSVLNMFIPSYTSTSSELLSSCKDVSSESTPKDDVSQTLSSSTPIANCKTKDISSKRSSPLKESVVFKNDLERQLQWKDDTTINFKEEKTSNHKALFQTVSSNSVQDLGEQANDTREIITTIVNKNISNLDVSYKSSVEDRSSNIDPQVVRNSEVNATESDSEFLDCETIYSTNESYMPESFENFHKIMPLVGDTTQTAFVGYVEDHIHPPIYEKENNDTAQLAEPIIESHSSVILEVKDTISHSNIKLAEGLNNLPINTNILSISKGSCMSYLKDVDNSLQVDIQTINLPGDLSNNDSLYFKDTNNVSREESCERNVVSELTRKKMIEPMKITATNLDFTENSIPKNHLRVCIEDNQLLPEMIQINLSHGLCVNKSLKISDTENEARNYDIEIQKSEYLTNSIIEKNNKTDYLDEADIYLSDIRTTDCSSNDNEGIVECEIVAKSLDETFICENFIHSTNSQKTNINMDEQYNLCEVDNAMLKDSVNEINQNAAILKDLNDITLNENYNIDSCSIQKKHTIEFEEINSSEIQSSDNYLKKNPESLAIMEIKSGKTENDTSHVYYSDYKTSDKLNFTNVNCDDKSLKFQKMTIEIVNQNSDYEDTITVMDCELGADTLLTSEIDTLESKYAVSNTDITMNNVDTMSSRKDINHIQNENEACGRLDRVTKFPLIELKNILPSDIPLPHDEIENKRLIDDNSVKNKNNSFYDGVTALEMESSCLRDKSNSKSYDSINKSIFIQQKQALNEVSLPTLKSCNDKIQNNCNMDLQNSQSRFNFNQIMPDSNEDLQPAKETPNTECTIKVVSLPDIIQAASAASGKENLCVQKSLKVDNSDIAGSIKDNVKINNEEILIPTSYSLYVSVPEKDPSSDMPTLHNKFELKTTENYNINFDKIDNPFATKTNVRMSPQPETLLKSPITFENNKHENKKCLDMTLKDINDEIIKKSNDDIKISTHSADIKDGYLPIKNVFDDINDHSNISNSSADSEKDIELLAENTENNRSVAKSMDGENSKSVFNLPEIHDSGFNPFRTISRICPSPPQILDLKDTLFSENDIKINSTYGTMDEIKSPCGEDNIHYDKDISNIDSTILRNSDEVHTEDEDTIEGPFIETENLVDEIKASDIEIEKDAVQIEDLPASLNNDDDVKGELFIDAETFEFLLNQNKSNVVADSGKESLFLKFDPLFAKRVSSDSVLAELASIQKKQSTPKKLTLVTLKKGALDQTFDVESLPEENDALLYFDETGNSVCKPMMVVNPAINSNVTPQKFTTSIINRESLTFSSPAMLAIDRLLSQGNNTTLLDQDDLMPHIRKDHEAAIALTQLREHLAEKEVYVHNLKCESKELRERLFTLESQVRSLENEMKERLRKINDLNDNLVEKTKSNKTMAAVVEEYERTIATLITEIEQDRRQNSEERAKLINERDEQTAHLASMERSFCDLHSKYEKSKQILLSMKANEDTSKKSLKEFDDNILKMHNNYEQLKQHATSKLNSANQELEKMNRAHHKEVAKLTAMIKRKNLHVTTLEESLAQKMKVNEELTAICDELINKVG